MLWTTKEPTEKFGNLKTRTTIVTKAIQVAEGEAEYDINFNVIPKRLWKSEKCSAQLHRRKHTEFIPKRSSKPF